MRLIKFLLCILAVLVFTGCQAKTEAKPEKKVEKPKNVEKTVPTKDGSVVSFKKIDVRNVDSTLDTYKMTYMSGGTKVVAYVAAPEEKGTYQLEVDCHGGYTVSYPDHVNQIDDAIFDKTMLRSADYKYVTLMPLYSGYGESEGDVHGLYRDTADAENGITAIKEYFNKSKEGIKVSPQKIHLEGTSLGGGVVLKLASERDDIASVVANSPYVGADITYSWAEKNQDTSLGKAFFEEFNYAYGEYDPDSVTYKIQSIDYKKINAPVLLLQGKEDQYVNWQTVQTFYEKMKAADKPVTLKLYPHGKHALPNSRHDVTDTVNEWYAEHVDIGKSR